MTVVSFSCRAQCCDYVTVVDDEEQCPFYTCQSCKQPQIHCTRCKTGRVLTQGKNRKSFKNNFKSRHKNCPPSGHQRVGGVPDANDADRIANADTSAANSVGDVPASVGGVPANVADRICVSDGLHSKSHGGQPDTANENCTENNDNHQSKTNDNRHVELDYSEKTNANSEIIDNDPEFGACNDVDWKSEDDNAKVKDQGQSSKIEEISPLSPKLRDDDDDNVKANENDGPSPLSTDAWNQAAFDETSRKFFYQECRHFVESGERGGGLRRLAYRCLYSSVGSTVLSVGYALVVLQFMNLLVDMSPDHKERLVGLVTGIFSLVMGSLGGDLKTSKRMPKFPKKKKDVHSAIMGGDSSLWKLLPCEEVVIFEDMVTISIDSLIDHLMAQRVPLSMMQDERGRVNTNGINGSEAAKDLLERLRKIVREAGGDPDKTAFGYLILWSDGFLTSWVKQKDNSCWCMTVTVAPPNDNDRSVYHTHCIALGGKGSNQEKLIVNKLEELQEIRKGKLRYDAIQNKWINTSFDVIVYMADRPERSEIIRALSHKGISAKRFRYAAPIREPKGLAACDECLQKMILNVSNNDFSGDIERCTRCCNWDYSDRDEWQNHRSPWHFVCPRPANYPSSVTRESTEKIGVPKDREVFPGLQYIKPHEQDFDWLKQGAELTLAEVSVGSWTMAQGREYLGTMAVCKDVQERIVGLGKERCDEMKESTGKSRGRKSGTKRKAEEMDERNARGTKRKAEEMFDQEKDNVLPAIWSMGYPISMFIECPMHLIFLGVTKALVESFTNLITSYSDKTALHNELNGFLEDIASFRLDYCLTKTLPDTLWVSENYIALARLLPWAFGHYCANFKPKESSKNDAQAWQLKVNAMQKLLNSYNVMVSTLMSRDKPNIGLIEQKIKIFLTTCNEYGMVTGEDFWTEKGNFYSLLNLPQQIQQFGPLRDWWDGDFEKIRPDLKRVRRSMSTYFKHKLEFARRKRWLMVLNENFGVDDADNTILDMMEVNPDEEEVIPKGSFYSSFYRYRSIEDIRDRLNEGQPLCGFIDRKRPRCFYVAFGNGRDKIQFVAIFFTASMPDDFHKQCSLNFCKMKMQVIKDGVETPSCGKEDFMKMFKDGFCLVLPLLSRDGTKGKEVVFAGQYTILTKNWEVLGDDGLISKPGFCKDLYDL